jgi:hypothetical protein
LFQSGATLPVFRDPGMSVQSAAGALVVGKSSKQEVAALLGPGEALRFDNGYEVWAYRGTPAGSSRATPELVVLFSPAGVVHKVRVRPAT